MIITGSERLLEYDRLADELKLPTTSQIARDSRDEFLDLAQLVPWRIMRELDSEDLYLGVYGFDSIRTIYVGEGLQSMERVFNHPCSGFRLIRESEVVASFVNLRSARRIIDLNPDVFTETQTDPGRWTIENFDHLPHRQMGLLSGFPRTSVMDYELWINFLNIKKPGTYDGSALLEDQRLFEENEISRKEFEKRARKGLAGKLRTREIEKLIKACTIRANIPPNFGVVLFTEEDVMFRSITLQFLQYLRAHPDFSLERVLGS